MEHEVLDGQQIDLVLQGKPLSSRQASVTVVSDQDAAQRIEKNIEHGAPLYAPPPREVPNES